MRIRRAVKRTELSTARSVAVEVVVTTTTDADVTVKTRFHAHVTKRRHNQARTVQATTRHYTVKHTGI